MITLIFGVVIPSIAIVVIGINIMVGIFDRESLRRRIEDLEETVKK